MVNTAAFLGGFRKEWFTLSNFQIIDISVQGQLKTEQLETIPKR